MKPVNRRNGASLVVVLALLAVCSVILFQLLHASLQQSYQLRRDLQREQTQWLLRAGEEYAAIELETNDGELPDDILVELPSSAAAKLKFVSGSESSDSDGSDSEGSDVKTVTISAQIGDPKMLQRLTVISSRFKIPSDNIKPDQE